MRNLKLLVEYDGTDFHGFQRQAGDRTVQEELERAAVRVCRDVTHVTGAGRTDAGVHAIGQVVNFRTANRIPIERVALAFNSVLPSDVAVREAEEVDLAFHARRHARLRVYRYRLLHSAVPSPLRARYTYRVSGELNLERMNQAAQALVGEHDFRAFCCRGGDSGPTRRDLTRIEGQRQGDEIVIEMAAPSFLYRMVRTIVGVLLEVGQGRKGPEDVVRMLRTGERDVDCAVVPPQGLCLVAVYY